MTIGGALRIGLNRLSRLQTAAPGTPATFTWKGKEIGCVTNTFAKGTVLVEGGFEVQADAKIYVLKEKFLTVDSTAVTIDSELYTMDDDRPTPVAGKTLKLNGQKLRVIRTHDPLPADSKGFWVLYLVDPNQ